jgi:hypothetical protein
MPGERRDERDDDRHCADERGAEALQEQVDDQDHEHDRLEQRDDHLVDRQAHEVVGVEGDAVLHPVGKDACICSIVLRTAFDTSRPLAPGCWYTAMIVAAVPFIWLSTMYCCSPISARATSPTRTIALPSWLARRMMFSYCLGSVYCGCVMTGT